MAQFFREKRDYPDSFSGASKGEASPVAVALLPIFMYIKPVRNVRAIPSI
jgi:hypothetical protein